MNWRSNVARGLWLGSALVVVQEGWQVVELEGSLSLLSEVTLHQKLSELAVFSALLLSPRHDVQAAKPSTQLKARAVAWSGALWSAIAWLSLRDLTPWSWWCLVVAMIGLLTPWSLRRPRWRGTLIGTAIVGYLTAMLLGYSNGSGYFWYPIPDPPPAEPATREEAWAKDIDYLGSQLPRLHGNAFHTQSREAWRARLDELTPRLSQLENKQVGVELARLVASVGDAHTSLSPWWPLRFQAFPWKLQHLDGDWFVVATVDEDESAALGGRLIRVGDTPVEEAVARIKPVISAETEIRIHENASFHLLNADLLAIVGVIEDPTRATLTVELTAGEREFHLESVGLNELDFTHELQSESSFRDRHPGEVAWYEVLDPSQTMYFRYRKCPANAKLRAVAAKMFAEFDERGLERLIVDLRGNPGGSSYPFKWWVLAEILSRPTLNQRGNVFCLIDARTFSSGMRNAIQMAEETEAILVGQPTGGSPNSWGEVRRFTLPNSGLDVWYSTTLFGGEMVRDSLHPDVELWPTIMDLASNRDPVLEYALEFEAEG